MEISIEESVDVIIELIGCAIVVALLQLFLNNSAVITLLERMV